MKRKSKKVLSIVMAVVMILSCWVWAVPENLKAEAANSYKVTIGYDTKRRVESGTLYTKVWYTTRSGSIGYVQASSTGCRSTGTTKFDITNIPGFPYYIMCWLVGSLDYEENNLCRTEWNYASINDGDDIFPDQYSFVYESLIGNNTNTGYWLDDKTKAILLNGYTAPETADHTSVWDWADPLEGQIGEIIPSGYDFDTDRWNFYNITETIDLQYYIDMYEEIKGCELWHHYELNENGLQKSHGHCYGMATSTSATLTNAPNVTNYISWTGLPYTKLKQVNKGTANLDMNISAKDYIKYCHIYQHSYEVGVQRHLTDSHKGIQNVYNAVLLKSNNDNTTGIVIDFFGGPGGHTVYAVGIDGDDILVNDSNEYNKITKIEIDGDKWTYSGGGYHWSSDTGCTINYVDTVITPYICIKYGVDIEGIPSSALSQEAELNGTVAYYATNMKKVDEDKNLIVTDNNSFNFEQQDIMLELRDTIGADNEQESESKSSLYWLDNTETLSAENTSDEPAEIKVAGNEAKITAELPSNATTEMTVKDGETATAGFTVNEGDKLSVTFTTLDENNEFIDVEVSGTASGETVTAEQTETGVSVEGFDSMTITYETANGTDTEQIKNAGGEKIEITTDEENSDVSTDYVCKHIDENTNCVCDKCETALSHTFTAWQTSKAPTCTENGTEIRSCTCGKQETRTVNATGHSYGDDNMCDNCGEEKTCTHLCHQTGFMGCIWKFVRFFWKLFKMNPTCECGKAHY